MQVDETLSREEIDAKLEEIGSKIEKIGKVNTARVVVGSMSVVANTIGLMYTNEPLYTIVFTVLLVFSLSVAVKGAYLLGYISGSEECSKHVKGELDKFLEN